MLIRPMLYLNCQRPKKFCSDGLKIHSFQNRHDFFRSVAITIYILATDDLPLKSTIP